MTSVLIVDDHAASRALLAKVVASAGHTVFEAASGETGLELARSQRPDLIIADILMPTMDGYEFVRELRGDTRTAATRLIFCTATYLEDAVHWLAESAGVDHILRESSEPEEIVAVVERALAAGPVDPASFGAEHERGQMRATCDGRPLRVAERKQPARSHQQLDAQPRPSDRDAHLLFDRSPLPMLVYDRATFEIVDANRAFVSSYGYSPTELLAMTITDLVPLEDAGSLQDFLAANPSGVPPSQSGEFPAYIWRHRYKHGAVIDVEVTTANVTVDGRECRIAACLNVTERTRATAELAAARNRADEATGAASALLADIGYESRTPLSAVVEAAEQLLGTQLSDEQRRCAEPIVLAGEHMMALIEEMLALSSLETGHVDLGAADFDLHDMFHHACAIAAVHARARGISLDLAIGEAVPRVVSGDGRRMRRVLLNVVSSAVSFTAQGNVVVAVAAPRGPEGTITVRCDVLCGGVAIDPEITRRLFGPAMHAERSTARASSGPEVGLAIAQRVVEVMGGTIGVESKPGRGSIVWFEVGLAAAGTSRAPRRTGAAE